MAGSIFRNAACQAGWERWDLVCFASAIIGATSWKRDRPRAGAVMFGKHNRPAVSRATNQSDTREGRDRSDAGITEIVDDPKLRSWLQHKKSPAIRRESADYGTLRDQAFRPRIPMRDSRMPFHGCCPILGRTLATAAPPTRHGKAVAVIQVEFNLTAGGAGNAPIRNTLLRIMNPDVDTRKLEPCRKSKIIRSASNAKGAPLLKWRSLRVSITSNPRGKLRSIARQSFGTTKPIP